MKHAFPWPAFVMLGLLLSVSTSSRAQGCSSAPNTVCFCQTYPVTFTDTVYKTGALSITDGAVPVSEDLRLRIYRPAGLPDTVRLPLFVLVHGGGYFQGSYADNFDRAAAVASYGWAVATVGHRICRHPECLLSAAAPLPNVCGIDFDQSLVPSAYAAAIDLADAVRFLQTNAASFNIHPDFVMLSGDNSGGTTALNLLFADQAEWQSLCPTCGDGSDSYYGDAFVRPPGLVGAVASSALMFDTTWIDAGEANTQHVMLTHGTRDELTPYESGGLYCCYCSPAPSPDVYGSAAITERLHQFDGSYYLLTGNGCGSEQDNNGFGDQIFLQIGAYFVKAIQEGVNVRKHSIYPCNPQMACFGGAPLPASCIATASTLPLTAVFGVTAAACNCPENPDCSLLVSSVSSADDLEGRVFPNPATDALQFEQFQHETRVQLFAPDGRLVRDFGHIAPGASTQLSLAGLPPGLYWLRLFAPETGAQKTVRIVVER